MKSILTIAGSDPSGGAGIQVDLLTFHELGVRGFSVVTALTAQNDNRFFSLNPVSSLLLREQLQAISSAYKIDAIKIGMLGTEENVLAVKRFLEQSNFSHVVLDPVLKSSTGAQLLDPKGFAILKEFLIPMVTIVTPNLEEAEALTRGTVRTVEQMKDAALHLYLSHKGVKSVLIKGGHLENEATDVLYDGHEWKLFTAKEKIPGNVHGTGCALSSALAVHLALNQSIEASVTLAKEFMTEYLRLRCSY